MRHDKVGSVMTTEAVGLISETDLMVRQAEAALPARRADPRRERGGDRPRHDQLREKGAPSC